MTDPIDPEARAMAAASAERRAALHLAHCEAKLVQAIVALEWAEEHTPGPVAADALHMVDHWRDEIDRATGGAA